MGLFVWKEEKAKILLCFLTKKIGVFGWKEREGRKRK